MNLIGKTLNALPRKKKTILVLLNDLFLSFICWLVFGPPMATILSTEFSASLPTLILDQIYSFAIPALMFIAYFYFFGSNNLVEGFLDHNQNQLIYHRF